MPAIAISPAWKAWRVTAPKSHERLLRRLTVAAAEARHDYRMGNTAWDYTALRNSLVAQALKAGIPNAVVAEAALMSVVKVYDIRREATREQQRAVPA